MSKVDKEIDRYLFLLRNKIRERGFTQLEESLGWGRSYISQLLTRQKVLRFEQVLLVLKVIDVQPEAFFGELYGLSSGTRPRRRNNGVHSSAPEQAMWRGSLAPERHELAGLRTMTRGLRNLLLDKGVITEEGLSEAVRQADSEPTGMLE